MKLVLFDIDGTLLNCGALGIKSLRRTLQKLYKNVLFLMKVICPAEQIFIILLMSINA